MATLQEKLNKKHELAKEIFDKLGGHYIYSWEKDIVSFVSSLVSYNMGRDLNMGEHISVAEVKEKSLEYLSLLGNYTKAKFIEESSGRIITIDYDDAFDSFCSMHFISDEDDSISLIGSPILQLVSTGHQIDSIVCAHESIHFMKDTSLLEYRDNVYVEAIPIFLELLCLENGKVLADEMFRRRIQGLTKDDFYFKTLNFMSENKMYYFEHKGDNPYHVEDYLCTSIGGYIFSFYVAVILFNQYKQNPKRVLELVRNVIEHKMTTREMFGNKLNFGNGKEIFEKEYSELKKVL